MKTPSSLSDSNPATKTRPGRASVMLNATVERFGGQCATTHRVRDLSPGGVRIDQATELRVGSTVLVSVGSLEAIGATIKWVSGGNAGLEFAEQINPDEARTRAAIAPQPTSSNSAKQRSAPTLREGWIRGLKDPYTP
jgi:hypothetical protein